MAEDWAVDVKKYVPDADDAIIKAIVRYCGIALTKRDSSLVSFSDPKETLRVRNGYCRKKLGLTDADDIVDAAIARVGERMKADRTKNRVTVYYLLAEHFGKLGVFAAKAAAGTSSAALAAAALAGGATAAAGGAKASRKTAAKAAAPAVTASAPEAAAVTAAPPTVAAAFMSSAAAPAAAAPAAAADSGNRPHRAAAMPPDSGGFLGLAAAVFGGLVVLVFCLMLLGNYIGGRGDAPPPAPAPVVAAPAPAPAAPVIPEGSGIVSETVAGMPKVSVYFDTGSTVISPDFAAAVAPVKAWTDANPTARLAVSGFNDPTGNAAANAELSKNRAQAVAAALADQGVPAERIGLVKPADTTATDADMAQARRVEIVVVPGV